VTEKRRHHSGAQDYSFIGPKGSKRKDSILDALDEMLKSMPWRGVNVLELSRRAQCSPALFYDYFPTLESAFFTLMARTQDKAKPVSKHIQLIHELLVHESMMKMTVRKK
jgi:AcrR family transcriptional regulator